MADTRHPQVLVCSRREPVGTRDNNPVGDPRTARSHPSTHQGPRMSDRRHTPRSFPSTPDPQRIARIPGSRAGCLHNDKVNANRRQFEWSQHRRFRPMPILAKWNNRRRRGACRNCRVTPRLGRGGQSERAAGSTPSA